MELGWIGTGVMGEPMAKHLMKAGNKLVIHSRTKPKAQQLLDAGAQWGGSPRDVAERSEVVFTMLGHPADVEEVYLGPFGIFAAHASQMLPRLSIDLTTSSPELARRIANKATKLNTSVLDAPVSGGDIGAKNATLSIMVGGQQATFHEALPLLQLLGRTIEHMGEAGMGQHAKLANQILVAGNMIGCCEALLYGTKQNLDLEQLIGVIGKGAAGSWSINNLGPRVVKNDFEPGFYVEHFLKDMQLALDEAARIGLALPGLALVQQLYRSVAALGHGRSGTQALYLALKQMSEG